MTRTPLIATASSAMAVIGLLITYTSFRVDLRSRELALLNRTFDNITQRIYLLFDKYATASEAERWNWGSLLFNEIEYFSFRVNERFIRSEKLIGFFKDALVQRYEQIFLKHSTREEIEDPNTYSEMKELHRRLKEPAAKKRSNNKKEEKK